MDMEKAQVCQFPFGSFPKCSQKCLRKYSFFISIFIHSPMISMPRKMLIKKDPGDLRREGKQFLDM